jgi:hypothetical protein
MQRYEIRLLKEDRYSTKFVVEQMHLNDHAAIGAGSQLAQGSPFEVWHDLECVYGLASDRPMFQQAFSALATRG